jgi:phycocyanobilin lyase beta subunit
VQLGNAAVLPLLNQIDQYNYGGRAWAIRALAEIADPRGLETLLSAAETDFAMSVRRAAAKGLGNLCWSELPSQQVLSAQSQALKTLLLTSQDPEWVVRYASVAGLEALANSVGATQLDLLHPVKAHFEQMVKTDSNLAVRTRARLAMQRLQSAFIRDPNQTENNANFGTVAT